MISYQKGEIGEYLTLKSGFNTLNEDEYIGREGVSDGFCLVRNIRSLRKYFDDKFRGFSDCDFAKDCEKEITKNVIDSVVDELKREFSAFQYQSQIESLKLSGLSAKITSSGISQLMDKFTGEGKNHIIYDAVDSRYPMMLRWNLHKDRWDSDRKQHYDYYENHYSEIFPSYVWEQFVKDKIIISGIDLAKRQTSSFINLLIKEYISYAKLAQFLK